MHLACVSDFKVTFINFPDVISLLNVRRAGLLCLGSEDGDVSTDTWSREEAARGTCAPSPTFCVSPRSHQLGGRAGRAGRPAHISTAVEGLSRSLMGLLSTARPLCALYSSRVLRNPPVGRVAALLTPASLLRGPARTLVLNVVGMAEGKCLEPRHLVLFTPKSRLVSEELLRVVPVRRAEADKVELNQTRIFL